MEFVLIPAGEFLMGSHDGDQDEKPPHRVRIRQPFYLSKYEVTQGQWHAVMGNNPSYFKGDLRRPVESVSWEAVQEFIRRLQAQERGTRYRLPTEAEWEYAVRAGTTMAYSFGNEADLLKDYAWYKQNAKGTTHPVGQKRPNAWGLYDMAGNVFEWVQDWYGDYPAAAMTDPQGPSSGSHRVIRGGSWNFEAGYGRSSDRGISLPNATVMYIGFRLLRIAQ
jgi:formylglycine-generating enzyme required for sulfatase activity